MECILAKVELSPSEFPAVIRSQRQAVEAKILEMTNLHVVQPGLEHFGGGGAGAGGAGAGGKGPVAPENIPGVKESGWCALRGWARVWDDALAEPLLVGRFVRRSGGGLSRERAHV